MQPDLIYDVGFNVGNDTRYYLAQGFRVVAVEADPVLGRAGRERFADAVDAGQLTLLNVGITDRAGVQPFYVNRTHHQWSSFDPEWGRRGGDFEVVDVPCRTFDDILAEHGVPHYLKIDIEGHDRDCIDALDPAELPPFVSFEIDDLEGLLRLRQKGYNAFKLVDQIEHDRPVDVAGDDRLRRYVKRRLRRSPRLLSLLNATGLPRLTRARGGGDADEPAPDAAAPAHSTTGYGDSGPFGERLAGRWRSVEDVAYEWLHVRRHKEDPASPYYAVWYDLHATRLDADPPRFAVGLDA